MPGSTPHRNSLSAATASREEWLWAIGFLSLLFVVFVAVLPFVQVPLARVPSFIPAYESVLFFSDLITAFLLLTQFIQLRSRAVLVLAAGFLFDALIIVPHILTFPGAFSDTGLLGAGEQTTAWIYVFWHGGFPLFMLAYAYLRPRDQPTEVAKARYRWMIAAMFGGVVAAVCAVTALTTLGEHLLPRVIAGGDFSMLVTKGISPSIWVLSLVALIALWRREATILDLCLMVVMAAWLMDIALSALINSHRFDLGFYAGRIYGLIAAGAVLVVLLFEIAREHRAVQLQLIQTQKMEAVGRLTGGIAHDFNNLLAGVIGNIELAIDQASDRPEVTAILAEALQSALRGADLVKRMLAFSRVQPLQLRSIDLIATIDKLGPLLRASLGEQITVDIIATDGLWPVRVDPAELENCVINLCINSRDAMPDGGRITIEASNFVLESWFAKVYPDLRRGDYVVLSVNDHGSGMPPEVIARAFEPFYTTKDVGKGSGLGLSMVHSYMKQSGGAVKIYSEIGVGTTMSLYFPRGTPDGAAAPPEPAPVMIRGGTERILVVEDNPLVSRVAVGILQSLGYRVTTAETAHAALTLMKDNTFDVVFSDVVMPGMNGIDLGREVRRLYPGVGVLLTSGFSSKLSSAIEMQSLGIDFVAKPYRKSALAAAIRAAAERPSGGAD
jgi:signal transduction histidine kinase/ActR/RegA family two-component response regulator